ncbi:hypothetical protein T484DRAFT_1935662 [Baffinella frigidus]|nr:hypothetical protein T484DRAFT_1935662 [Cryptophyta sp. CCMP2293]
MVRIALLPVSATYSVPLKREMPAGDENAASVPCPSLNPASPAPVRETAPARKEAMFVRCEIRLMRWSAVSLTNSSICESATRPVGRRKDASPPFAAASGNFGGTLCPATTCTFPPFHRFTS